MDNILDTDDNTQKATHLLSDKLYRY